MRKTPGASALLKIVKKHTQVAVATEVGVSPSTISRYVAGALSPQHVYREAFERLYSIPVSSWETPKERKLRERTTPPAPVEAAS